jgi:hypothetical protein
MDLVINPKYTYTTLEGLVVNVDSIYPETRNRILVL